MSEYCVLAGQERWPVEGSDRRKLQAKAPSDKIDVDDERKGCGKDDGSLEESDEVNYFRL